MLHFFDFQVGADLVVAAPAGEDIVHGAHLSHSHPDDVLQTLLIDLLKQRGADHATVTDQDDLLDGETLLDDLQGPGEALHIVHVAREDLVGYRDPLLGH